MRTAAILAALALAAAAGPAAAACSDRLSEVAGRLPDLTVVSMEEATARTGLDEEQIEAVLATLDAARIAAAAGEEDGCLTMVEVAADLLDRGAAGETGAAE